MKDFIVGNVRRIIYENTNSYKVGIFKVREISDEKYEEYLNHTISFVGNFNNLNTELNYKFYGSLVNHPKYGIQFNVNEYEIVNPSTNDEIISYLGSGYFKGIGLKLAKKIVDKFGEKTIKIIKGNPNLLSEVGGISVRLANNLYEKLNSLTEEEVLISNLTKMGFSVNESIKIIKNYKLNLEDILKNNLYILTNIMDFDKVDAIYKKYNDTNSDLRIENIIMYSIKNICYKTGNTLASKEEIYIEVLKYFENDFKLSSFKLYVKNLIEQYKIYEFNDYLMLNYFYETEASIANKINIFNKTKSEEKPLKMRKHLKTFENKNNIILNEEQKNAIRDSIINNLFIISGGPGTGKTTIIKGIVDYYEDKKSIVLLAPTGRSAKRMSESVGISSYTLHKFLKWNKEDGTFGLNEYNKSIAKIVIIDEFSMVDIFLFSSLLAALNDTVKLILVGDANQLPSINPGNILYDLLNSESIKKQYLYNIYRTNESSYINILADRIKNKQEFEDIESYNDFKFIDSNDENIIEYLNTICNKIKKNNMSLDEFQVLVPMYKGQNGIDNLNNIMQNIFNPYSEEKTEIVLSNTIYREGDKVIQLVNDVDNNIYNGDIGYIEKVCTYPNKSLEINFNGNIVKYESDNFDKISLSYAISIHKSQGSEYDNVVVILANAHKRMFYNKLIYTGCTRAKKSLIIIGKKENFNYSIKSNYSLKRITNLKSLL